MNVIWLQLAPIAFENIGWKSSSAPLWSPIMLILIFYPDTRGLPLENSAALFDDEITGDIVIHPAELKLSHEHKEALEIDHGGNV